MRTCTIVACNYLPHARVLATSYAAHHRGERITVLLTDDRDRRIDASAEPFDVLHLDAIAPDARELHRQALIYDVTELATAVKPLLLRHLLDHGDEAVVYLDPDICIYAPIDDVGRLAAEHSLVLTPHTTEPMPRDGRTPDEADIMASGVFNLGFVAVGPGARPFLDWWSERLRRDCVIDHQRMLFTDQRWIDLVPGLFEHHVLRDRTLNVAYWNVYQRPVELVDGAYEVDGRALRFFHFSGFSTERPHLLSGHQGVRPRVLLSEQPVVAALCADYTQRLHEAGLGAPLPEYGWGRLPGGLHADTHLRRVYRRVLLESEATGGPEPPDPFDEDDPSAFATWLSEPMGPPATPINRYLHGLWAERPDLQAAYPRPLAADAPRYRHWLVHAGSEELGIPVQLRAPTPAAGASPHGDGSGTGGPLLRGVNVAGYLRAELGMGEAGRLAIAVLEAAGVPHATYVYSETTSRQDHAFAEEGARNAPYDVNLLCINADQVGTYVDDVGHWLREGRYTIGSWAWELDELPATMHGGFDHVDEVWALSSFTAGAIARATTKPVLAAPPPIVAPPVAPGFGRADLDLPTDRPLLLFLFDFLSVVERKNPLAVLEAFTEAFRPGEGPVLLIKTINGDQRLAALEALRAAASRHPDVVVIDRYLTAGERGALVAAADGYVSLHRSEGFGLTLGEAMALGTPVIATRYSGNLDFMDDGNSWLVDAELVPVPAGCDPYPEGAVWAEPDVHQAAAHMRTVVEHTPEVGARAQQALADVAALHSPRARAAVVRARLDEIAADRQRRPEPSPSADGAEDATKEHLGVDPGTGWLKRVARSLRLGAFRP